jgi:hypothetical protein
MDELEYTTSRSSGITFPALVDLADEIELWTDIRLFSEIELAPDKKTIVFCDIDDTLLHHPVINVAWSELIQIFFNTNTRPKSLAAKKYNDYLESILHSTPMMHTDKDGFFEMAERVDKLVFVTARPRNSMQFTHDNLNSIGVDPERFEVHFSDRENKGLYIKRKFDVTGYDCVVFIDDQRRNLENVFSAFSDAYGVGFALKLYRFCRMREDPYTYYPLPEGFPKGYKFNGEYLELDSDSDEVENDRSLGWESV